MTAGGSVKARSSHPSLVAVIASLADLHRATRLRRLPDVFEVRLDGLHPLSNEAERAIEKLTRPLIMTARHPLEGGYNDLSSMERRRLHLQFLPRAAYVDIELRSCAHLRSVLAAAQEQGAKRIISVHDFRRTPPARDLERLLHRAQKWSADVFKMVTRTETPVELLRLLTFFEAHHGQFPISAMGIGKIGRESRVTLMKRGSVLNYVQLGARMIEGQFDLREIHQRPGEP